MTPFIPFAIGAIPGIACSLYLAQGWADERLQRCESDRIAAWARMAGMCARSALERQCEANTSLRALADDRGEAIDLLEADVAALSASLCDAAHELAEHKAHPGRAMRRLQLVKATPAPSRLAADPVYQQAQAGKVAA